MYVLCTLYIICKSYNLNVCFNLTICKICHPFRPLCIFSHGLVVCSLHGIKIMQCIKVKMSLIPQLDYISSTSPDYEEK